MRKKSAFYDQIIKRLFFCVRDFIWQIIRNLKFTLGNMRSYVSVLGRK